MSNYAAYMKVVLHQMSYVILAEALYPLIAIIKKQQVGEFTLEITQYLATNLKCYIL